MGLVVGVLEMMYVLLAGRCLVVLLCDFLCCRDQKSLLMVLPLICDLVFYNGYPTMCVFV